MALTVTDVSKRPAASVTGARVLKVVGITFDSSYAPGGEDLSTATLGLSDVEYVSAHVGGGYSFEYDYSAHKLKALFGNNDAADGPLIEASGDLSTVVTRALVVGTAA